MALGPFSVFSFPGVYTQTLNQAPTATAAGELRIPAFIGVGEEQTLVSNYEMIRGSSAMADNQIVNENVSGQFDGTNRNFTVSYFPIVDGSGAGITTNDPSKISVMINGKPAPVASVNGATGEAFMVNIPAAGDTVLVTYYYKESDTLHLNEDLSDQVDGIRNTFTTHFYPIVDGSNGGVVTTDPTKISVKVNGVTTAAVSVDGGNGRFTLAVAPTFGSSLEVTYYDNDLQNTADILPSAFVASINKVGYAPGTTDFINGVDYVLDTTQTSQSNFSTIQWGASYKIVSGQHTNPATDYFDASHFSFQQMYDNRVYNRECSGTTDATNITFGLPFMPTDGGGRGIATENPAKIGDAAWDGSTSVAFQGLHPWDSTADHVIDLSETQPPENTTSYIQLQTPPPAPTGVDGTALVFATQYMSRLVDDIWTITCVAQGGAGVGQYTITGQASGAAMNVDYTSSTVVDSGFSSGAPYPLGQSPDNNAFSDALVVPGHSVQESVTLTFINPNQYVVTSSDTTRGTGTAGDNTGNIGQTYIDKKTGFRITYMPSAIVFQAGDWVKYNVSPIITIGRNTISADTPTLAIPGIKIAVNTTADVSVGDTAVLTTYNKSGAEPNIGDFYYVSFYQNTQFNSDGLTDAVLYTQESDVFKATGQLTINNKIGLAAHLAFLNGAAALALLQIQKTTGGLDAPASRYIAGIDYFNEPMTGGIRPNLMEPLSTDLSVLSYLKTSNVIQSGIRYANERYSWFGFALNTSPSTAQVFARSMASERMMGIYPDGAITTIPDAMGNDVEYVVDGAMLAAAVAGRDVSPAFDVAEPMTKKPIVGFTRLYRRMDSVTAGQTANSGLTLLEELSSGVDIRFALTTDTSSVLTRTPSIIRTKDFIQRGTREILTPYIGQKLLSQRVSEIEQTLTSYLSALQQAQVITAYQGVQAAQDPNDPTIINVQAFYSPVFPLLWIVVTFNLQSSI